MAGSQINECMQNGLHGEMWCCIHYVAWVSLDVCQTIYQVVVITNSDIPNLLLVEMWCLISLCSWSPPILDILLLEGVFSL